MFPHQSQIPVTLVHVCNRAWYHDHFIRGNPIIQDLGIFILRLADDVDRDVQAKGFREAGLEKGLVAELCHVKAKGVCGFIRAAGVDFGHGLREERVIAKHVQE